MFSSPVSVCCPEPRGREALTTPEGPAAAAGQEGGQQSLRAPDQFCSQQQPAGCRRAGGRQAVPRCPPFVAIGGKVLVLAHLQAGEREPPDLLDGKQFIVWHARACGEPTVRVTKPLKCCRHAASPFVGATSRPVFARADCPPAGRST
jgi:hypothetical protein